MQSEICCTIYLQKPLKDFIYGSFFYCFCDKRHTIAHVTAGLASTPSSRDSMRMSYKTSCTRIDWWLKWLFQQAMSIIRHSHYCGTSGEMVCVSAGERSWTSPASAIHTREICLVCCMQFIFLISASVHACLIIIVYKCRETNGRG